jgi:hypothetical protein
VQATTTRPKVTATADGEGVVSHAGSRLLADVADRTTLTAELSEALAVLRKPRARHDPGRVLVDMAVAVADGARTISDVAVLADQAELFGRWPDPRPAGRPAPSRRRAPSATRVLFMTHTLLLRRRTCGWTCSMPAACVRWPRAL